MIVELSMCPEDREALGGPEWLRLDTDRVLDTPAGTLIRWETETGYAIERAVRVDLNSGTPSAAGVLTLLWIARKQAGPDGGGQSDDGVPEPYAALARVRTLRVQIRSAPGPKLAPAAEPEGDAVPPGGSPAS